MSETLSEQIEIQCQAHANHTAMLQNGEVPVTFANFFFTILRFAECLSDKGVRAGHVVAMPVRDPIALIALKLAVIRLGASAIAVGHQAALNDLPPRVDWAVVPRDQAFGHPREILFDADWIRSPTRLTPVTPGGRIIHATSGTTGIPKLRADTEENLMARIINGLNARGPCDGPVFIGQNIGSLVGLKASLTALLSGQLQVHMLGTAQNTLAAVARTQVVHAFVPPIHLRSLVQLAEEGGIETPALRRMNVGGGTISSSFAAKCEAVFGCEVYNDYGSTETDTIASHRISQTPEQPGMVGRIYPIFKFRFTGVDGQPSTANQGGELWLNVPPKLRTSNYPDTAPLFDASGWISTGDIGRIEEGGMLVLEGRKSDLINVGGNKIATSVFEKVASEFSGIAEVAAFRVPTDSGIDDVGFAVVPAEDLDQEAFQKFLIERLGDLYRVKVMFLEQLPTTETGKIDRNKLTDMVFVGAAFH